MSRRGVLAERTGFGHPVPQHGRGAGLGAVRTWEFRVKIRGCKKWSISGHPDASHGAFMRHFAAEISGFAAEIRRFCGRISRQVAKRRKTTPPQRLRHSTLLSPEATEVSHGVHSPAAPKFTREPGKFPEIPEIREPCPPPGCPAIAGSPSRGAAGTEIRVNSAASPPSRCFGLTLVASLAPVGWLPGTISGGRPGAPTDIGDRRGARREAKRAMVPAPAAGRAADRTGEAIRAPPGVNRVELYSVLIPIGKDFPRGGLRRSLAEAFGHRSLVAHAILHLFLSTWQHVGRQGRLDGAAGPSLRPVVSPQF